MTILDLVFAAYNIVGTGFSIAGGIAPAIKKYYKTTAVELFKKSFVKVVKQYASDFADQTDPKTVEVDQNPLEDNFMFLAENAIRLKGTRVGIETILYEYIHNSKTPVVIADYYYTPTLEQVYATILYYLQNQEKVGTYLENYLEYCRKAREEYEKNPPPGIIRLRELIAERKANSDTSYTQTPKNRATSTTQSPSKNEQG